jgi:hypothetical protein
MRMLVIAITLAVGGAAYAQDPLEALSLSMAKAQAKDAQQVGEYFRGAGPKTDYQVLLEANKCYWFSGTSEGVKKLNLYLWAPNANLFTPRVADAKSDGQATMAYCTQVAGMYKLQVKTEGKGRFVLGTFAKDAPKQAAAAPAPEPAPAKKGPDLGPICDKTASVAASGAKRVGDFFDGKGNSIGSSDKSDYSVMMEKGKCYWAVGCADPDKVKSLYLYLWGPDNKRITEAKSDNPNPMVGHCAAATGMFKVQAKMNSGNGTYKVGVYVK